MVLFSYVFFSSDDFKLFGMNPPTFDDLDEVNNDISQMKNIWGIYEEYQQELGELTKENWLTFRSKTYRFDEFLSNWQEKIKQSLANETSKSSKKSTGNNMNVRIQQEIDNYRLVTPLFKWVRGEALSADHWLEVFRLLRMPRGTMVEQLTFGDILKVKQEIANNAEKLKVQFHDEDIEYSIVSCLVLGSQCSCTSRTYYS